MAAAQSVGHVHERSGLENAQRALLNILEDFTAERSGLEFGQRAVLNILEDFEAEKAHLEGAQRAVLNILEDFSQEKTRLEGAQRAVLNILEDFVSEKVQLEAAERAVLNILDDFSDEKGRLEATQRAVLNILEDFDSEKLKVEGINRQLEKQIEERKRAEEETHRVNRELAAANKELEAFTYSVSHDLRAPLRHVAGFSRILLDEHRSRLDAEALSYLHRVLDGARQMGNLVDDLLKLSRVGRQELTLRTSDLNGLVQNVLAELPAEAAGRQIEWRIGTLPTVECDAGLVKQVFANLLANAAKFTRVREHAVIEVGSLTMNGQPVIFVRDNGTGFSMKYAHKLFGVFQRLHRIEDFEGTGIGLATVQRIVNKHRGQIWAEAELDQGATFYFSLGSPSAVEAKDPAAGGSA